MFSPLTGNTLPEQVEDFIAHGVDEVIEKPVKLDLLKDCLIKHHLVFLSAAGKGKDTDKDQRNQSTMAQKEKKDEQCSNVVIALVGSHAPSLTPS